MTTLSRITVTLALLAPAAIALAADDAPGGSGGGNPFAGQIYQSIAAVVVFLGLLAILWQYAWDPILGGLQARENKIKEDLESAEQASQDAAAKLAELEARLAEAHQEAREIVEKSREDAERIAATLKSDTEREIVSMRQRVEQEIESAKQQAVSDIYAQAASLSTELAGRILQRQINEEDARRLVDQSLAEMNQN